MQLHNSQSNPTFTALSTNAVNRRYCIVSYTDPMSDTKVGTIFLNRKQLADAGIHKQQQAGIWTQNNIALSIVLSGGYEDDEDYGDVIIYTGEGGRDAKTHKQVADQLPVKGNLGLMRCKERGLLVHVTRGADHTSMLSPDKGYRYAGKYIVEDYWRQKGLSDKFVYRFRLIAAKSSTGESQVEELPPAERRTYVSERIVRDTKQSELVKQIHDYTCQVCDVPIDLPHGSRYAEGAHIRPLGNQHNGPDRASNILCLCPNHHIMFDNQVFSVDPFDYSLIGDLDGHLTLRDGHDINPENFIYHNKLYNMERRD